MSLDIQKNELHYYVDLLRGKEWSETGNALYNVIRTMRLSRHDKVCGEDFSQLDFGNIPFNGIHFSLNGEYSCDFSRCILGQINFIYGHATSISAINVMSNENWIITGGDDRRTIIWDIETGSEIYVMEHPGTIKYISSFCDSDGEEIIVFSRNIFRKYYAIEAINIETGEYDIIKDNNLWLVLCCVSSDHKYMFTCSCNFVTRLWDIETGKSMVLEENMKKISVASFSKKNSYLICGYTDSTITIWDVYSGNKLHTLVSGFGAVTAIDISPDEKSCLIGFENGEIALYQIITERLLWNSLAHKDKIVSVRISSDGKYFLSASKDKTIEIWESATKKSLHIFNGHTKEITNAVFSSTGQLCFSVSRDRNIKIWDVQKGTLLKTLKGNVNFNNNSAFSNDGKICISCSDNNCVRVWNMINGKCSKILNIGNTFIIKVFVMLNNMYYITGSENENIKLVNVNTEECIQLVEIYCENLRIEISPNMEYCALSLGNSILKLINLKNQKCVCTMYGHKSKIISIAFSNDSRFAITGSEDLSAKVWNILNGKCVCTLIGHTQPVCSVSFSLDGDYCITGSYDRTARLWNSHNGECLFEFKEHVSTISGVSFISKEICITGSNDGIAKMWNLKSGKCIQTYEIQNENYDFVQWYDKIQWEFPYCIQSSAGIQTVYQLNYDLKNSKLYECVNSFYTIEDIHINNCRFHNTIIDDVANKILYQYGAEIDLVD